MLWILLGMITWLIIGIIVLSMIYRHGKLSEIKFSLIAILHILLTALIFSIIIKSFLKLGECNCIT